MGKLTVDLLNPFITASTSVVEQLAQIKLKKHGVNKKTTPDPSYEYAIMLGIVGDLKGQVTYSLSKSFARTLVSEFLGLHLVPAKLDEHVPSGLEELGNMITGNAAGGLESNGVEIDISPPSIIAGSDYQIEYVKMNTIQVIMFSEAGSLEINLALTVNND